MRRSILYRQGVQFLSGTLSVLVGAVMGAGCGGGTASTESAQSARQAPARSPSPPLAEPLAASPAPDASPCTTSELQEIAEEKLENVNRKCLERFLGELGASSAGAARESDSSKLYQVGQVAKAVDYTMSVENVTECQVKYYFKPKKGNIKLGVEVQLEGASDQDVPVNPYYGKLTDSDGYAYTSTFGGCAPELKAERITKGEKAHGWVTFELPEKASGIKFSYSPIIIGATKQALEFDLGR